MRWKINRRVLLLLKHILIKLRKQIILAIVPQDILTNPSSSLERHPQSYSSKVSKMFINSALATTLVAFALSATAAPAQGQHEKRGELSLTAQLQLSDL